jgi:Flp pilus assembly secretin CpaC
VFDVYVRTNLSLIDSQIRALFPKDDIRLSQANGSVVLSGNVSDPRIATQAEAVVQAAGFKTVNLLESPVKSAMQVQLQVRVAEVSRNKMRELGTSYAYQASPGSGGYVNSGTGPSSMGDLVGGALTGTIANSLNLFVMGGNTLAFIRALQQQGALRSLAEARKPASSPVASIRFLSFRAAVAIAAPYRLSSRNTAYVSTLSRRLLMRITFAWS